MATNYMKNQIFAWIDAALENEDIVNYNIDLTGSSEKGERYATDVVFVNIKGIKKTKGESVELNWVLKIGKDFKGLGEDEMREVYGREIFSYDRLFPEYRKFEESKKSENFFDSVPKCIKTFNDEKQVIVFENLRKQGYEAYDKMLPMNLNHIRIVLKNYAKFHAIGFVFRDQRRSEFDNLTKNYTNLYKLLTNSTFNVLLQVGATKSVKTIKEVDGVLAVKIEAILQKDIIKVLEKVLDTTVEESVITHGDCWSSNFLFKYDDDNKICPMKVAILDWQLSSVHSPLIDLSYFMFIVSSKDQVAEFDNLLEYYYEHLCQNILEFGSDPSKLLPRSKFLEHWKIFSTVGYFLALAHLDITLCDKNDAPALSECKNEEELINVRAKVNAKDKDMFLERIISLSTYYFNLNEIK